MADRLSQGVLAVGLGLLVTGLGVVTVTYTGSDDVEAGSAVAPLDPVRLGGFATLGVGAALAAIAVAAGNAQQRRLRLDAPGREREAQQQVEGLRRESH